MRSVDLSEYFKEIKKKSKFNASLAERGGYITFENTSGKSFTLGLDSIISIIKDILKHIDKFEPNSNYDEKKWRDLSAANFYDSAANAISTVQTKPLFTTISKLINWANKEKLTPYSDNTIDLTKDSLEKTIYELEYLADLYSPKENSLTKPKITEIKTIISEKELKHFAFKTFKLFLDKYGYEKVVKNITEKDSKINETEYTAIKIKSYFGSGNLIGTFKEEQNKESLSSSNTPRFFEENLNLKEYPYSYFTTQWGDVDGDGVLSFNNLQKFITDLSNGDFEANKAGGIYSLIQKTNLNSVSPLKETEQKIYYGAPGTGKSYKVDNEIKKLNSTFYERITFHPEFDHASFVGGYRPVSRDIIYTDKNNEEYTEHEVHYEFVSQAFTNIYVRAWNDLDNQYYLAIEEINRGNCAEIFGDIFQLLDRKSNYTVSPSSELKEYLNNTLTNKDGINNGLKLPPNLSILATMNTSDQSLFPMDSAFKRRWDWEYIPICYDDIPENESYKYNIIIDNTHSFKWIDFIKNVNAVIKNNPNLGMDKCIGNYFIKSDSKEISLKEFINKAIFYLWNDVFKDEDSSDSIFEKGTSYEDFFPIETKGKDEILKVLKVINIEPTIV